MSRLARFLSGRGCRKRPGPPVGFGPSSTSIRLLLSCCLIALQACADQGDEASVPEQVPAAERSPAQAGARGRIAPEATQAEDGQWTTAAKDYASSRYSGLDQITTANVSNLRLAWSFSTGVLRGHEAAPLVVGSTMYFVTPHPNLLYALNLERDGALKWRYDPGTARAAIGVACCDVVNRGAAYADGRVFFNTLDAHTVAVDAETGKELWKVRLGDINIGESITMAPLVVRNKVYVGNSGGEFGVRGWITALDTESGKIVWRAYNTGPDADVLIGENFKPFYEQDRGKNLGVTTWPPDQWRIGGSTVWGWLSYDPARNLLFHGTANPGSWNPAIRPGDNKWSSAIFARNADNGQALWAYQHTPHDEHDYDAVNESILLDLPIDGRTREVLVKPERNGFVYVMDRGTGEVISADTFGLVNWAKSIDLETGRPVKNPEKATGNRQARNVCPAAPGMKDWQPSSYSPRTGLVYIPHNNLCMDYEGVEANYIAGTPYVGAEVVMHAGPGGHRGVLSAWDPVARRKAWEIRESFPVWSGTVVTAGDVVFYGTMDRWFKAIDARSGKLLWQSRVGSGIVGQPVTYRGPDGKQYVAVPSGVGGWAGAAALGLMPEADRFIALGFAHAVRDLPDHTGQGGAIHVFALP